MAMTLEYAQTEALMKLIKENTEALRENTLMMKYLAESIYEKVLQPYNK